MCVRVSVMGFEAADAVLEEHSTIRYQTLTALHDTNITKYYIAMWGEGDADKIN
jgi:hypothetical protein